MEHVQTLVWPNGVLLASWSQAGLCNLNFGSTSELDPHEVDDQSWQHAGPPALAHALSEYFAGEPLDFSLDYLDWSGVPPFHQQVLRRCAEIPRGATMTYGQLAAAVGRPAAARAVGQAMARNRWPLIVPCHRVLGHAGKLTGYSGLGGTVTKQWLLDMETAPLVSAQ
jgi:methylated-DNA-[protein]-cysteine S-methyltransferase